VGDLIFDNMYVSLLSFEYDVTVPLPFDPISFPLRVYFPQVILDNHPSAHFYYFSDTGDTATRLTRSDWKSYLNQQEPISPEVTVNS